MPENTSTEKDDADPEFVEIDPTGRYGRYRQVLGKGAFKTVYKAFDELEGIEVAWNQVKVKDVLRKPGDLDRLYSEVHLLQTLKHKNIIKFYCSWVDTDRDNINFITEIFTSGNLREYREKHKHVDIRAVKNWSRQILQGLLYLHSHDPPVIHRDLKCDNIFVNGNHGEVKIGDLGLAAMLCNAHSARSVIGTPEFMAPELYEQDYNELVDIYAFGMCLLELATFEYPYAECTTAAQIYKKVTSGIKPASLAKVKDPRMKRFIEKCIANASERLPARELLMDPFLQPDVENENIGHSVQPNLNYSAPPSQPKVTNIGDSFNKANEIASYEDVKMDPSMSSRGFTVQGERKDVNKIFLKLRIANPKGDFHNIHFPFDIEEDTSISVASEMVAELDLTNQDVTAIAAMIDSEIQIYIPEWVAGEYGNYDNETAPFDNLESKIRDEVSALPADCERPSGSLVLELLPSGRKYWCDSPRGSSGDSPTRSQSNVSSGSNTVIIGHGSIESREREHSPLGHNSQGDHNPGDNSLDNLQKDSAVLIDRIKDNHDNVLSSKSFEMTPGDVVAQEDGVSTTISRFGNTKNEIPADPNVAGDSYLLANKTLMESKPDHVKSIIRKLEYMLLDQQKELLKLKNKHNQAIANILKELPPQLHRTILQSCQLKGADQTSPSVESNVLEKSLLAPSVVEFTPAAGGSGIQRRYKWLGSCEERASAWRS